MNKLFILSVIAVFLVFPIAAMDQEKDKWASVGKKKKTSSSYSKRGRSAPSNKSLQSFKAERYIAKNITFYKSGLCSGQAEYDFRSELNALQESYRPSQEHAPHAFMSSDMVTRGQDILHTLSFQRLFRSEESIMREAFPIMNSAELTEIDRKDFSGQTPLAIAAWKGCEPLVAALVEKDCDVNSRCFKENRSILHLVVRNLKSNVIHKKAHELHSAQRIKVDQRLSYAQALEIVQALNSTNALDGFAKDTADKTALEWLQQASDESPGKQALTDYIRSMNN